MSDSDEKTELDHVDIIEIMKLLPHRYPFLLVDRVVRLEGDKFGVGVKNVTINENFFQGHFPEFPVMPGVLIIEGMAQTAGILCIRHANQQMSDNPNLVFFMSIDRARFRKPVVPGDRLEYHVTKIRGRGTVWRFSCEAFVDEKLVAEAEIAAMVVPKDQAGTKR